jgi:hypothetical protein
MLGFGFASLIVKCSQRGRAERLFGIDPKHWCSGVG